MLHAIYLDAPSCQPFAVFQRQAVDDGLVGHAGEDEADVDAALRLVDEHVHQRVVGHEVRRHDQQAALRLGDDVQVQLSADGVVEVQPAGVGNERRRVFAGGGEVQKRGVVFFLFR